MSETYRESDGHHPSRHFLLDGNETINIAGKTTKHATRTVHNNLDTLHKAVHEFQCLCRGRSSFLLRQPVQSL